MSLDLAPSDLPVRPAVRDRRSLLAAALIALVRLYQRSSAWRTPRCRFTPTCSRYAVDAIEHYGALRGGGRALRRLSRCHPWNPGGHDPVVPDRRGDLR